MLRDAAVRELQLTPDQVASLRATMAAHQPGLSSCLLASTKAQDQLRDAIKTTPLNEENLQSAAKAVGDARCDLALTTARLRADLRLTLSPGQLTQVDQWHAQIDAHITTLIQSLQTNFDS